MIGTIIHRIYRPLTLIYVQPVQSISLPTTLTTLGSECLSGCTALAEVALPENLQSVEVFNLVGQLVMTSDQPTVDMSELNQGVYFVRVMADRKTVTKRVVKQ